MTNLHVGQKFSTFTEFEQYLSSYENENFVKFSKRDSRKIESAVRSGRTKVELNPDLIYFDIKYSCVRGGAFRVQGSGKRKTSSCKVDCSAHILLRAAADGKTLEVKSFDDTHNHEISKVIKKTHPNENICPQPQTPKMSGPIEPSTNNSTKQGQKFSLRKRKCDEIEDIEEKTIKTQSDMAAELKKVAKCAEDFVETSSALLQTLVNIRNNIANMSQKLDLIVHLMTPSSSNV